MSRRFSSNNKRGHYDGFDVVGGGGYDDNDDMNNRAGGGYYQDMWERRRNDLRRLGVRSETPVNYKKEDRRRHDGDGSMALVPSSDSASAASGIAALDTMEEKVEAVKRANTNLVASAFVGTNDDDDGGSLTNTVASTASVGGGGSIGTASPDLSLDHHRAVPGATSTSSRHDDAPGWGPDHHQPVVLPPLPAVLPPVAPPLRKPNTSKTTTMLITGLTKDFQGVVGLGGGGDDSLRKNGPDSSATVVTASTQQSSSSSTTTAFAPLTAAASPWWAVPPAPPAPPTPQQHHQQHQQQQPQQQSPLSWLPQASGGAAGLAQPLVPLLPPPIDVSPTPNAAAAAPTTKVVVHTPKTALHRLYGKPPRRKVLAASDYYTWHDNGPTHDLRWTSAFLCPLTGELFLSGRWDNDMSSFVGTQCAATHEGDACDDGEVVWYSKKTNAEHGAAARALDCLLARAISRGEVIPQDTSMRQWGRDPPYLQPKWDVPMFVPAQVRDEILHRQAQMRNGPPVG